MILLSPARPVLDEQHQLQHFLEAGLPLYHIRHYTFDEEQMRAYLSGIPARYRDRLVLHSHFHLAKAFGINRLHVREADRVQRNHEAYIGSFILSTSVHSMDCFNALASCWAYAFLSPVFPSISKQGYGMSHTVLDQFHLRRNTAVGLVGLGGINAHNYQQVLAAGADDVAFLGGIWDAPCPLSTFDTLYPLHRKKQCNDKQTDLM